MGSWMSNKALDWALQRREHGLVRRLQRKLCGRRKRTKSSQDLSRYTETNLGTDYASLCPTKLRSDASKGGCTSRISTRNQMGYPVQASRPSKRPVWSNLAPSGPKRKIEFLRIKFKLSVLKTGSSLPDISQVDSVDNAGKGGIMLLIPPLWGENGPVKRMNSS